MLEVEKVDLYYGAAIALRQVSISVNVGAVTCLLGRNGVGKTSMLRAIVGAHPISTGSIKWEGEEISRLPMYERARRRIAWVPQGRDIFPLLTVKENLETGFAVLPRAERKVPDEIFDLFPVLMSIVHWGDVHRAGKTGRPLLHHHVPCGHQFDPVMVCSECREALDPRQVRVVPGPGAGRKQQQLKSDAG